MGSEADRITAMNEDTFFLSASELMQKIAENTVGDGMKTAVRCNTQIALIT